MIELQNTTKLYGRVIGVNDLTLALPAGAFGLVGPNGSGKTTLINLLIGQLRPTLGTVRIFGEDPWRQRDLIRRVGLCPATDILYPNVSALEWVQYLVRLHGFSLPESKRLAEIALHRVGMTAAMHRVIGSYSLGMRQRTKIAQAIAHEPEFLILDEPYNGLDPVGRYEMTELLKTWTAEGRGLLFASHVLQEIEAVTSSFLLIYGGRVLATGTAKDIESILAETPQEIRVIGRDAPQLIHRLAEMPWVDSLQLLSERTELKVALREPVHFYEQVAGWISEDGLRIDRITTADGNLAAIFSSLLKHHRGELS
ncbi:ABC transporter ATP-binding protein [Novipirellula artificiosorum]|uniref:Putative ABC transporter ATP-binding protein YxlF n=1 Tax=Novipirellula artificiosorum TaxID=2528016 RepID=A0A5C6E3T8_9BACT|nr:ABC transporter ATP-binding protein [Novipirellula artificiosorum]TWU42106.1 putative ABC transporter ATP-binding protein YxlF [Novipirellula artificiosorum]